MHQLFGKSTSWATFQLVFRDEESSKAFLQQVIIQQFGQNRGLEKIARNQSSFDDLRCQDDDVDDDNDNDGNDNNGDDGDDNDGNDNIEQTQSQQKVIFSALFATFLLFLSFLKHK